jgi:hypothetical protein
MKNKVIFVVLCAVLLLLFASLSHGGGGNPPPLKDQPADSLQHQDPEDPWDRLSSRPLKGDENSDVVIIVIDIGFCYIFNPKVALMRSQRSLLF